MAFDLLLLTWRTSRGKHCVCVISQFPSQSNGAGKIKPCFMLACCKAVWMRVPSPKTDTLYSTAFEEKSLLITQCKESLGKLYQSDQPIRLTRSDPSPNYLLRHIKCFWVSPRWDCSSPVGATCFPWAVLTQNLKDTPSPCAKNEKNILESVPAAPRVFVSSKYHVLPSFTSLCVGRDEQIVLTWACFKTSTRAATWEVALEGLWVYYPAHA